MEIVTPRLLLRRWIPADREPFARMNADPAVMNFFPSTLTKEDSDGAFDRIQAHFEEHGFGLLAVEVPGEAAFIGFIGLAVPRFHTYFTPCVEIGWRLARSYHGRGLATEGAQAVVTHAFGPLGLREIVSFTTAANLPSRRVMEKIGMTRSERDGFDHPGIPEGHAFRRHVLYRLRQGFSSTTSMALTIA
jgi:RimJ/RimL family protein N-acetyltransferase